MPTRPIAGRTYVAELGSGRPLNGTPSDYICRAVCTRCRPTWRGPVHATSYHRGRELADALLIVRDDARRDVLEHADRVHAGRMTGA